MSLFFRKAGEKIVIIFCGPPAAGKSTLCLNVANLIPCCYIDKDDFVFLSNLCFFLAHEEVNRDSTFFKDTIRDPEMDLLVLLVLRSISLAHNDVVVIPSPYSGELALEFKGESSPRLENLKREVNKRGAKLCLVYVNITKDEARRRWRRRFDDKEAIERNPNARKDPEKKLKEKEAYYDLPADTTVVNADYFFLFDGCHPETSFKTLLEGLDIPADAKYDEDLITQPYFKAVQFDASVTAKKDGSSQEGGSAKKDGNNC